MQLPGLWRLGWRLPTEAAQGLPQHWLHLRGEADRARGADEEDDPRHAQEAQAEAAPGALRPPHHHRRRTPLHPEEAAQEEHRHQHHPRHGEKAAPGAHHPRRQAATAQQTPQAEQRP